MTEPAPPGILLCSQDRRFRAAVLPHLASLGLRADEGAPAARALADVVVLDASDLDPWLARGLGGRVVVRCTRHQVTLVADRVADFVLEDADPEQVALRLWMNAQVVARARPLRKLVRHDLRGPLTVVLGQAELLALQVGGPLSDKQKRSVAAIDRQSEQLRIMIDDLAVRLGNLLGWPGGS